MGNHGGMEALGRRAAIGVTTVALLLAAAGSSLAAVRASRYEGGLAPSGLALPAPAAGRSGTATPGPTTDPPLAPDGGNPSLPVPGDPSAGVGPPGPSTDAAPAGVAGTTSGPTSAGPAASTTPGGNRGTTVSILGPATGPTPTTAPNRSSSASCPNDQASGALPTRRGALRAVDYSLPWPLVGPLVLIPQASASRAENTEVRIVASTGGRLAEDGSTLTLTGGSSVRYTLAAGQDQAQGWIRFVPVSLAVTANLELRACRDRSFVLYDMARATRDGHALRIVGVVADTGAVTIDNDGGTARFRGPAGIHRVTLLTADDAGTADSIILATVVIP